MDTHICSMYPDEEEWDTIYDAFEEGRRPN